MSDRPGLERRRSQIVGLARWLPLLGILVLASGVHLWGITADLPYAPDVDEPIIIQAAVRVASGHLNPGWFGHPGSTLIYPIAMLIRVWYGFMDPASLTHVSIASLNSLLATDPAPFYLIGRAVAAAYGVASVGLAWQLGRRLLNNGLATLAALVLPASWILIYYGQLVRTDTAGLFFALLTILLVLRAMDRRRARDWLAAGAAIGIAISTRYFLVALVVPYLTGALVARRWAPSAPAERRPSWLPVWAFGLVAVPIAFVITSPMLLIRWHQALNDLRFEARSQAPGADGLSPLGNLAWYFGVALPATVGLALMIAAVVGAVVVARRNPRAMAVLVAFLVSYAAAVSLSPLHWDRYVIPMIPVLAICGAIGLSATVQAARARLRSPAIGRGATVSAIATTVIAILYLAPGLLTVAHDDRLRSLPSTRVAVTDWARTALPRGVLICEELYTTYEPTDLTLYRVFSLADHSLDEYRNRGCAYLISSSAISSRFTDAGRYPSQAAFYETLSATGRLVETFSPGPDVGGSEVRVYVLPPPT